MSDVQRFLLNMCGTLLALTTAEGKPLDQRIVESILRSLESAAVPELSKKARQNDSTPCDENERGETIAEFSEATNYKPNEVCTQTEREHEATIIAECPPVAPKKSYGSARQLQCVNIPTETFTIVSI
jgi:hypothetical protein